jgi:hypothetical protein
MFSHHDNNSRLAQRVLPDSFVHSTEFDEPWRRGIEFGIEVVVGLEVHRVEDVLPEQFDGFGDLDLEMFEPGGWEEEGTDAEGDIPTDGVLGGVEDLFCGLQAYWYEGVGLVCWLLEVIGISIVFGLFESDWQS